MVDSDARCAALEKAMEVAKVNNLAERVRNVSRYISVASGMAFGDSEAGCLQETNICLSWEWAGLAPAQTDFARMG